MASRLSDVYIASVYIIYLLVTLSISGTMGKNDILIENMRE